VANPDYAPTEPAHKVRPFEELEVPHFRGWVRPAEVRLIDPLFRSAQGSPGPDQGYALRLAENEIKGPERGVRRHDLVWAVASVAMALSARSGRAPTIHDVRRAKEKVFSAVDEGRVPHELLRGLEHDDAKRRKLVGTILSSSGFERAH
jgi:hypothetical protein